MHKIFENFNCLSTSNVRLKAKTQPTVQDYQYNDIMSYD